MLFKTSGLLEFINLILVLIFVHSFIYLSDRGLMEEEQKKYVVKQSLQVWKRFQVIRRSS